MEQSTNLEWGWKNEIEFFSPPKSTNLFVPKKWNQNNLLLIGLSIF